METFNINDPVWVRLTPRGLAEIQKDAGLAAIHRHREEVNGWTRWQLWELMAELGKFCYMGGRIPFETEIRFAPPKVANDHPCACGHPMELHNGGSGACLQCGCLEYSNHPVCDRCAEPALTSAVDFATWPDHTSGYWQSRAIGKVKHGCADHPVVSVSHKMGMDPRDKRSGVDG